VIGEVFDLERYPTDRLDSPLVEHSRETLRGQGALKLWVSPRRGRGANGR
jgi:hypothetical protein